MQIQGKYSALTGASTKIKEYFLNKAREEGTDMTEKGFEVFDTEIRAMLELLKNGMGEKSCSSILRT